MNLEPSDNVSPKKALGQHFLTSDTIARDIVEAGKVMKGDRVLEIGPGTGILTKQLLAAGASVIAIEKDSECIAKLQEEFAQAISEGTLTLIADDVRNVEPPQSPYKLVANIPYYITGDIIRRFLTHTNKPTNMALLVQKEVAERIAKETKESLLSLSVKVFGTPKYIKTVKAGSFFPKPKVDSAILAIFDISNVFFETIDESEFFEVLHKAFSEKRKQIGSTLGTLVPKDMLPIDPTRRPETLSLDEWKKIVSFMHKLKEK